MRIAVTGGTGYLGAHTVRALLEAGHEVRLLVAPQEVNAPVLRRFEVLGPVTVLTGDVRHAETVDELLTGADSVLHAAGIVGTDERRAQLMWDVNAYATEAVLTRAAEMGLDPVVSVSSYSALFPPPDGVITPDSPTAEGRSAYAKTKGYADRAARRLQDAGAPVVVTYPSSVVGPAFGTAAGVTERGWAPIVRWGMAPSLRGGMQMVDVRDVAEVHVRLMTPGRGPRRYTCGGRLLTFDQMVDALEEGTGRRIRRIPLRPGSMRALGRVSDAAGRYVSLGDGLSYEAALLLTAATPVDDSRTCAELDIHWRDPKGAIIASLRPVDDGGGQQIGDVPA
ncbi:NAD-dependent epimerase/dehydratase family protein [Mycolicibacterium sp. F2034L]|uniref:NAD-dependent epimerase/dehydratase family protein n=1 Tax=Mycolicibacterium sp. F2034L TaxID=2926422 RepID=UPI001FF23382|nr:NAD-dependent epimerase/dehydratase family protein [Mycolicibacterium sp. F2034L]MCK0175276.1 NAD-dependent epimerase/dehydratase family protein [Mycolicibacterium sp. F2034L]